jgi:spermidine synthase
MPGFRERAPLLPIALISAAALAYELLLTRIFAIVHWHHLVATAISLALLGYGISGTFLTLAGERLKHHFQAAFVINIGLFSIAIVGCVWIAQRLPFDPQALLWDRRQAGWLAAMLGVLALPFFAAANCIGLALATYRGQIPRIYGMDLLGAALGAVLLSIAVTLLHPADALYGLLMVSLALTAVTAWQQRWHPVPVALAALATAVVVGGSNLIQVQPAAYKDLSRALATAGARIDHHRNSIGGVIDVLRNDTIPSRFAPGLSLHSGASLPAQMPVFIDGDAGGAITDHGTAFEEDVVLQEMLSALPYRLLDSPRVVAMGATLDHRLQQALVFGATRVTALEPDPQRLAVLCETYLRFNRQVCADPRVDWLQQTARGFAVQSSDTYDLISLTTEADPGGLDALDIDYALTREALSAYLQRLDPDGMIVIEAPTRLPPALSLRLLATARSALQHSGFAAPQKHLAMIRGWQRFQLLIAPRPFDTRRQAQIRTFTERWGFDLVWLPDISPAETNRFQRLQRPVYFEAAARLLDADRQASEDPAIDERPITDDRPFPHRVSLWQSLLKSVLRLDPVGLRQVDNALVVAAFTLLFAILSSLLLILSPLIVLRRAKAPTAPALRLRAVGYFGLLGVAFLFTEIAWIQRLELFLDQPLYAAAIALTAFLMFAGLGSLWIQHFDDRRSRQLLIPAVGVIGAYALAFTLTTPALLATAAAWSYPIRLLLAVALLAPLAFAMGIPFAAGLRRFGAISPDLIPWAWGINGCASVISAASAAVLAPEIGFLGLIAIAAVAYLVLPWLNPRSGKPGQG